MFLEYKRVIQYYVEIFALDSLILCLFSPYDFEKNDNVIFWVIPNMNEIDKTNLSDQAKFRLHEIGKVEKYLKKIKEMKEINQRKWCCKKLSKYVPHLIT